MMKRSNDIKHHSSVTPPRKLRRLGAVAAIAAAAMPLAVAGATPADAAVCAYATLVPGQTWGAGGLVSTWWGIGGFTAGGYNQDVAGGAAWTTTQDMAAVWQGSYQYLYQRNNGSAIWTRGWLVLNVSC